MLKRAEKEKIIESLKSDIGKAEGLFVTNLVGVSSNDAVAVRKSVRDVKGKIVITRNSLFEKAAQGTSVEGVLSNLKGPHAVAFAFEEVSAVAKCLKDAGKELELISFKGGFFNGEELTNDQINSLASLPSREEMLGTMLATFNAPVSALARVLNAIKEQKEAVAS